ncbi:MAG: hypothetical protein EOL93_09535 [Epsilonproteobacteria bacterium]|nr:hypothetical protein [Campylobacterota bacterium]
MLKNVEVGDRVIGYPFGNGKVLEIDEDRGKYCVIVEFENCSYEILFSRNGRNVEWQPVPSCWTIKNAPDWIWEYFSKPKDKIKRLLRDGLWFLKHER